MEGWVYMGKCIEQKIVKRNKKSRDKYYDGVDTKKDV